MCLYVKTGISLFKTMLHPRKNGHVSPTATLVCVQDGRCGEVRLYAS